MLEFLLLIFGLLGLWIGTEVAVRSALHIAEHLQLSQMFIGLTLLAIGTDLPELVISVNAAIQQLGGVETSGIIVGNALGSSISNITLVLGIAGLVGYLQFAQTELQRDATWLAGAFVLLFFLGANENITRTEGGVMLAVYAAYCYTLFSNEKEPEGTRRFMHTGLLLRLLHLVLGIGLLVIASEYVVDSAVVLARDWGVEQSLIGLLIVGPGTSLPEIAVSVSAIFKKAPALSVGNIIGSNVFNSLVPIGVAAAIHPVLVERSLLTFDLPVLFVMTATALFFFWRKKGLQRQEAAVLLGAYVVYDTAKILGL